jgi:hypothetical protein
MCHFSNLACKNRVVKYGRDHACNTRDLLSRLVFIHIGKHKNKFYCSKGLCQRI